MVSKVMPVYRPDFFSRGHRGATDDSRKKSQRNLPFKDVLARELATAKSPVTTK